MKERGLYSILYKLMITFTIILSNNLTAQFIDNFETPILYDSTAMNGWAYFTGDGYAEMQLKQMDGYVSIEVDATKDKLGIWWAFIRRSLSKELDLNLLAKPEYELRIEARIRTSHAPRRVNLHLNTQRTTDFHSHLMEYDLPDTINWHTISMTTDNFDIQPGDTVGAQLALMDWGLEKYRVDLDHLKVDIVNIDSIGPDLGNPLKYRPPIPSVELFKYHIQVFQDAMIDLTYPDENLNNWHVNYKDQKIYLLTSNSSQYIIMRWDLDQYSGKQVEGLGLLELTTYSLERDADKQKDFGMIRVSEILDGDQDWIQENVNYNSLCMGKGLSQILNTQMIIDVDPADGQGSKNLITISQPVLQRMIDGKTLGLAIQPLGPINASFYAMENNKDNLTAQLHFNIK